MTPASTLEKILDLARWAPSGDNTQPWQFELVDDVTLVVHGSDTRSHCVYDLDGHPSQMSIGALLETIVIAASAHGWAATIDRRRDAPETHPTFDVRFAPAPGIERDLLVDSIERRSVQRRPMSTRPLDGAARSAMEAAAGADFRIVWLEGRRQRLSAARLMFANARLRLTMREAFEVHRSVIEWNARFSTDRIPDEALGVDRMTARVMRFVMSSWERVEFFNRYLAGTWAPRLQMDFVPSLACAAHFALVARRAAASIDDYIAAGRALQRVWLTATRLGLWVQPEMTPIIFARYVREGRTFSGRAGISEEAGRLAAQLEGWLGRETARDAVFLGRIGYGPAPHSRSVRKSLGELIIARRNERASV